MSRQVLVDSKFSTVICAPVYSAYDGLSTQVAVGPDEGLKHDCSIHCDGLVSILKDRLVQYVGALSARKLQRLDEALRAALALES